MFFYKLCPKHLRRFAAIKHFLLYRTDVKESKHDYSKGRRVIMTNLPSFMYIYIRQYFPAWGVSTPATSVYSVLP